MFQLAWTISSGVSISLQQPSVCICWERATATDLSGNFQQNHAFKIREHQSRRLSKPLHNFADVFLGKATTHNIPAKKLPLILFNWEKQKWYLKNKGAVFDFESH